LVRSKTCPITLAVVKFEKVMHSFSREVQSLFPAFAAATT